MPLTRDTIRTFLKAEPRSFCVTCLARVIRVPFDLAKDAWADIRLREDLPIGPGQCSACGATPIEVIRPPR